MKPAGSRWRIALAQQQPLQIVGVTNALTALLAKEAGLTAIYLSGAGVANGQFALPDLGLVSQAEILTEVRRITHVCELPLLVDIDTGGDNPIEIRAWIESLIEVGAAGCHIEDQRHPKRCGHRKNKQLCTQEQMLHRLHTAVEARHQAGDLSFYLIARTDAVAVEGLDAAIARAQSYAATGVDAIFAEAVTSLEDYHRFSDSLSVPVLANLTEFGLTPMLTVEQCQQAGIAMCLYPLTAFRMMNKAAELTYQTIKQQGSQGSLLPAMQTRDELYQLIDYERIEQTIDEYFQSLGEQGDNV